MKRGRYTGMTRDERQEYLRGVAGKTESGVSRRSRGKRRDYKRALGKQLAPLKKPIGRVAAPSRRGRKASRRSRDGDAGGVTRKGDITRGRLDPGDVFKGW